MYRRSFLHLAECCGRLRRGRGERCAYRADAACGTGGGAACGPRRGAGRGRGADRTLRGTAGTIYEWKTALDIAEEEGKAEVAALLRE